MAPSLPDEVRASLRADRRAGARSVTIDLDALGGARRPARAPAADAERHYLDGSPQDVAAYFLTLDAINFGSGWFPTLRKRPGCSRLLHGRVGARRPLPRRGPLDDRASCARCAPRRSPTRSARRRDHELMALYAQALRELGRFLGDRRALDLVARVRAARPRARRARSRRGMALYDDRGFYKRAQIAPPTSRWPASREFDDLDRADDLRRQPRPPRPALRRRARLRATASAAHIDAGRAAAPRPAGARDPRLRGPRVRAARAAAPGSPPRDLDDAAVEPRPGPASTRRARGTAAAASPTDRRVAATAEREPRERADPVHEARERPRRCGCRGSAPRGVRRTLTSAARNSASCTTRGARRPRAAAAG